MNDHARVGQTPREALAEARIALPIESGNEVARMRVGILQDSPAWLESDPPAPR